MSQKLTQFDSLKTKVLEHKWLLIAPIVGCTLLAAAYAVLSTPKWSATQPMVVREELTGIQTVKPGRFDSLDQMKTVQETIHEICKSPTVLRDVLTTVGPTEDASADWPSLEDIEDMQKLVSVSAPNGAEFGQTEILHITVKAETQARAVELVETLAEAVQVRYTELRRTKAESMEKETRLSVILHQQEVDEITTDLSKIESNVGVDLGELRSLSNPIGGSSSLQNTLANSRSELRGATQELESLKKQAEVLIQAKNNPEQIMSTSNELLVAQPALKKLKDGLIDAQLSRASVMGTFSEVHPRAKAAIHSESLVREQLQEELSVALYGLKSQIEVSESRILRLTSYITDIENRMGTLSGVRVGYENNTEDLSRARRDLATAKTALVEAHSIRQATEQSSMIVKADEALVGSRPDGIGKTKTAAIGMFCGLAIGIGLFMFVTAPNMQLENRKMFLNALLERAGGRRASDSPAESTAAESTPANVTEVTESGADVRPASPSALPVAQTRANDLNTLIDELREYEELIDTKLTNA